MNDKHLDDLFDHPIPKADANAKKIAINSALSEFSQAFEETARPIDNRDTWFSNSIKSIRSFFMNPTKKNNATGVFASVAVAFIAVSLVYLWPSLDDRESTITNSQSNNETATRQTNIVPDTVDDKDNFASKSEDITSISPEPNTEVTDLEEVTVSAIRPPQQQPLESESLNESIGTLRDSSNIAIESKQSEIWTAKKRREIRGRTQAARPDAPSADAILSGGLVELRHSRPKPKTDLVKKQAARPDQNEEYAEYQSEPISLVSEKPVSTFSIDVDTAAYSLIRNQLTNGYLPNPQAVRAEELINYFNYDYQLPTSEAQPFRPTINVLESPWNSGKKLVHIGIKGYEIAESAKPDSNLVFLLDVSGSMSSQNKLPLVKRSINLLLDTLKPSDTVSIVVYAGAAGTVLEPTKVSEKSKILSALGRLDAGGSTAGGAGIELAYQLAEENFNKDSVNRIILATDGDFNVGQTSNENLKTLVERKRDNGVFLSVLGFGRNNYQDDMMQTLAQNGNGVAAYIDTFSEAKKVLVDEATSTLFTIAKDVKIQVEFNPATVSEYRLIGYETRALNREDFNNDKVDAGDIGAGHTVTAIYEITPANSSAQSIDTPRYARNQQPVDETSTINDENEYGFLKIRYKLPNDKTSKLIETVISKGTNTDNSEVLFSTAVAGFAQLLTGGKYTGDLSYDDVIKTAIDNKGLDAFGYRNEFIQLVRMAKIAKK